MTTEDRFKMAIMWGSEALLTAGLNMSFPENRLLIVINRTDRNFLDIDLQRFR